jgi:hypothetical protein
MNMGARHLYVIWIAVWRAADVDASKYGDHARSVLVLSLREIYPATTDV